MHASISPGSGAISIIGASRPPADMVNAARLSLSERDFEELMRETGGKPPTPEQLCAKADKARE